MPTPYPSDPDHSSSDDQPPQPRTDRWPPPHGDGPAAAPDPHSPLHDSAPTSGPQEGHRLPSCARGNVGNTGNAEDPDELLVRLVDSLELLRRQYPTGGTAREIRRWTDHYFELHRQVQDLAAAVEEAWITRRWGDSTIRRVERSIDRQERHEDRERRRAEGGLYAGEHRSPNRPVHVEVDPTAWAVVKARSVREHEALAACVGRLVERAVDAGPGAVVHLPDTAPTPAPAERDGRRRFARLFVDDDTWTLFRVAAAHLEVSAARLLGMVVEAEARRLGWRPDADR